MRLWTVWRKHPPQSDASLLSINVQLNKKADPNAGFRVGGYLCYESIKKGLRENQGRTAYGSPSFFQFSAITVVSAFRCPSVGSFILPLFSSATRQ